MFRRLLGWVLAMSLGGHAWPQGYACVLRRMTRDFFCHKNYYELVLVHSHASHSRWHNIFSPENRLPVIDNSFSMYSETWMDQECILLLKNFPQCLHTILTHNFSFSMDQRVQLPKRAVILHATHGCHLGYNHIYHPQ